MIQELLEATPNRNADFHRRQARLFAVDYDLRTRVRRADATALEATSAAFHAHAIAEVLKQACAMRTQIALGNPAFEQPLLAASLAAAETPQYRDVPAVAAYYHAYRAASDDAQLIDFHKLREILERDWALFPESEMRGLYLMALNVCIRKINQHERAFEQEALEIYKAGLANKILLENGQLSPYTYKNVMTAAAKVGAFDWAHEFLTTYKIYLPAKERDNLYRYNLALLNFRTGKTAETMRLLQGVNLREPLFQLDARRLLARLYFEAGEWSALESLIDSTKIYLHRQKVLGYTGEMYQHFFKIMHKLLKLPNMSRSERDILRGVIEEFPTLAEREWLLGKLGS